MRRFRELQSKHEKLIKAEQSHALTIEIVQNFYNEIIQSSKNISSPGDRDQLRAYLRYWANYIYEKTQTYPKGELLPPPSRIGREVTILIFTVLVYATAAVLVPVLQYDLSKVGICHYTGSEKNPYEYIEVASSAVDQHQSHPNDIIGVSSPSECPDVKPITPPTETLISPPKPTDTDVPAITAIASATETPTPLIRLTNTPIVTPGSIEDLLNEMQGLQTELRNMHQELDQAKRDLAEAEIRSETEKKELNKLLVEGGLLQESIAEKEDEIILLQKKITSLGNILLDQERKRSLFGFYIGLGAAAILVINQRNVIQKIIYKIVGKKSIRIVRLVPVVHAGEYASIEIKAQPDTICTPTIFYRSTLKKLESKQADENGILSWTWKVSSNIKPGVYKIRVHYLPDNRYKEYDFEVKPRESSL